MAGVLTVSERILFHLSVYAKYEDKYESPFDVTQDGISQACSISRAHAAIELKKLKAGGIVDERLSHVRRGKSRRKVYFLTMSGKSKAADVVQYVKEFNITPMVDASKISPELSSSRIRSSRRSSPVPIVKVFFGREKDLELARKALALPSLKVLSVKGIAGIGKTTLTAKLVSELAGQRVFWYTARSWDATKSFADALGRFFYDNGGRRLASYLSSGKFELGELSFLLNEELAENGYTFVFDDVDASESLQEFLKMLKHSSGSAKIIVTSESRPRFYESSDVVAKKEVFELELGGLDRDPAIELLGSRGIVGKVADELFRVTHGHPLSLEMVTVTSPAEAKTQVSMFFEEKFYAELPDAEKSILQFASVFQSPFSADAVPKELKQARKGSMLREVAPGRFEIHASLKDFVYNSMTKDEKVKWHGLAADHYLKSGDMQERLYHLVHSNRGLEAEMMISRMGDELIGDGNAQMLWETIKDFEPSKPKYRQSVVLSKAKAASIVGRYDIAWSLLERVASDEKALSSAEALVEMGKIKSMTGEPEEALRLFSQAMDRCPEHPSISAKALRGLGVVEGKLGNYVKAQELLERSARDAMTAMDSKGMLLAHLELGNVFMGRGMFEQAIDHFSKCAAGFGPVQLTNVYMNMGVASASLGRDNEAKINLENAVRLADETGQPRSKAYALTSLAEVLIRSGQVEVAKEHCFRALDIVTDLDDKMGISAAYANLGMAEKACGNLHDSEEYYAESIAALGNANAPRALGLRKMELGLLLKEMGEPGRAKILLQDSKELFDQLHAEDLVARVDSELRGMR
jgi:tetratricopeptide (TPR) repeat protein/DNA-binding PadR family transcriptional regulator